MLRLIAIGLAAGLFGAILGVGGGVIVVPLLVFVGLRLLEPRWFGFHAIAHRAWWVYVAAVAIGLFAGTLAGLFGIGGGILLVPTLALALGLSQLDAEASSLLAMLPASWLGAWRQTRYGNVVWRSALVIGVASIAGVEVGIAIAERLPEVTLQRLFGVLLLVTAAEVGWRARRR